MIDKEQEKWFSEWLTKKNMYCQTVGDFSSPDSSTITTTFSSTNDKYQEKFNFNQIVNRRLDLTRYLLLSKGKEYARNENPFHNFDVGSDFTGMIPEDYLFTLNTKHVASIRDLIEDLYDEEKTIDIAQVEEKIGDAITYFILLEGLFKRRLKG